MSGQSVVVDTSRSPLATLRPVAVADVRLEDGFWAPRMEVMRRVTLRTQYEQCEATGRIDNFRRAAGKKQGEFQGRYYNDSDVYKWLEAASWALAGAPEGAVGRQGAASAGDKPLPYAAGRSATEEDTPPRHSRGGEDPDDIWLRQTVDGLIEEIAGAQAADGYLNTYFTFEREGERFTNLTQLHEL